MIVARRRLRADTAPPARARARRDPLPRSAHRGRGPRPARSAAACRAFAARARARRASLPSSRVRRRSSLRAAATLRCARARDRADRAGRARRCRTSCAACRSAARCVSSMRLTAVPSSSNSSCDSSTGRRRDRSPAMIDSQVARERADAAADAPAVAEAEERREQHARAAPQNIAVRSRDASLRRSRMSVPTSSRRPPGSRNTCARTGCETTPPASLASISNSIQSP